MQANILNDVLFGWLCWEDFACNRPWNGHYPDSRTPTTETIRKRLIRPSVPRTQDRSARTRCNRGASSVQPPSKGKQTEATQRQPVIRALADRCGTALYPLVRTRAGFRQRARCPLAVA